MMEDQSEAAFILYMCLALSLVLSGALILWLARQRPLKVLGAGILVMGIAGTIQFDAILQLAYERGLLAYLP